MEKVRYMISDAATVVGVESHVLRYWEDELELDIPRNEMGHRYYTRENIQQFLRIKELKEQGYQLKAIKMILHNAGVDLVSGGAGTVGGFAPGMGNAPASSIPARMPSQPMSEAAISSQMVLQSAGAPRQAVSAVPAPQQAQTPAPAPDTLTAEERMAQFRELMSDIVGRAISQNNEELSLTIGTEVQERVLKEMNYLMREQEEAAEDRYKKLDAAIRGEVRRRRFLFSKGDKRAEKTTASEHAADGKASSERAIAGQAGIGQTAIGHAVSDKKGAKKKIRPVEQGT